MRLGWILSVSPKSWLDATRYSTRGGGEGMTEEEGAVAGDSMEQVETAAGKGNKLILLISRPKG